MVGSVYRQVIHCGGPRARAFLVVRPFSYPPFVLLGKLNPDFVVSVIGLLLIYTAFGPQTSLLDQKDVAS